MHVILERNHVAAYVSPRVLHFSAFHYKCGRVGSGGIKLYIYYIYYIYIYYIYMHVCMHVSTLYVGMARICAEMRRTLKASKLRECENISLFRHFIILYGRYSSLITC